MKKNSMQGEISTQGSFWTQPGEDVLQAFAVNQQQGLLSDEVQPRQKEYGLNQLKAVAEKSPWSILVNQFKNFIVLLLAVAAALSFLFGDFLEGIAIIVVIGINAAIGFFTELKAVRSMEALERLGAVSCKVRRDGRVAEIPAEQLVPGDIVILEGGDIVSADLRIIEASRLQADESMLTGESVPVGKRVKQIEQDAVLAERINMLYKGTSITRGSGTGVVVGTGMQTELGKISKLVEEAEEEITPLEKRLDGLARKLIWVTLIIAALITAAGIATGKEIFLMIETGIALAVAAIPEGLPIVATLALARGMWRMARRNAVVRRLSAVETLGATNVIFTDKTGTLTENRMAASSILLDSGEIKILSKNDIEMFYHDDKQISPLESDNLKEALRIGVLCNNAVISDEKAAEHGAIGDPLEIALLNIALQANMKRSVIHAEMPEVREEAFDPELKMMATFHKANGNFYVAVKGAPETVIGLCASVMGVKDDRTISEKERTHWLEKNEEMAEQGLRVLALARKSVASIDADPYENLVLVGLVGLHDPPRIEVQRAIELCKRAGVRVIMVTGDQPVTALNIGTRVGLYEADAEVIMGKDLKLPDTLSEKERQHMLRVPAFARVDPEQKLNLIDLHQDAGSIVAMTGDGVNDAPALKEADIGVAMGQRGTQVAREAADMVLKDDAFATIVMAIEQGRAIFNNIRKFVVYLISCNVSEVMSVALAAMLNIPLPILPLQILFLNLITDVFPALALGMGEGDAAIMDRPPRNPKESILERRHWIMISVYGFLIMVSVLGALMIALHGLHFVQEKAMTVSFLTLALAQLWHVFNMRERGSKLLRNEITRNRYIWGALLLCIGLILIAVYVPGLATVLKVTDPGLSGWSLIIAASLFPLFVGQSIKALRLK
ncbi:MAG: cation-transporting P-type ATPase [bacterium]